MAKLTYTPTEFAALFGKERTWTYRQLYAGKVKAITKLGQVQIPHSEVEKLLNGVERYRGAASHVGRAAKKRAAKKSPSSKGAKKWTSALKERKKSGSPQSKNVRSRGAHTPSSSIPVRPDDPTSKRRAVYQRMTRKKEDKDLND
ncbi:helix-turn-helix domain-containing protein [Prosthecobacter debontii]|nr:helix-turn-helix domain-containing protein [Prosthecobacter debontii]